LSDHVVAIERNVEHCIENVGIGKVNKEVIGGRSHAAMGEDNPNDNTVSTNGQNDNNSEEKQKDELERRLPDKYQWNIY
jgi:hypothetical protein